ncbi:AraC family transcriptional regulator [Kitasatospora sp. NPDC091207]|uniref:AraC family transcriptional regulator n=1 Tax=Kitasatospora sp. NPDC091207 TaxID=3364083 RepID=UPI00381B6AC6
MTALARTGAALRRLHVAPLRVHLAGRRVEFLGWGFYPPSPWRNYWHSHSFFELCYAYAGRGVFRLGEEEYPVRSGDLFVARPGDVHEIVADQDDPLGIVFWSWTMLPERGTPPPAHGPHPPPAHGPRPDRAPVGTSAGTLALLDAFATGTRRVTPAAGTPVPRLLLTLAEEAAAPGPGTAELLAALGSALVLGCARAAADPAPPAELPPAAPGGARAPAAVAAMVRYLEDNFDRPVRVRDLAAEVHLSDRHAARLFRRANGLTIMAYLTRYRLDVAAQRLADPASGPASVAAIARSCGYPDARHFSHAFRRRWGVLPTQARRAGGTTHLAGPGG